MKVRYRVYVALLSAQLGSEAAVTTTSRRN